MVSVALFICTPAISCSYCWHSGSNGRMFVAASFAKNRRTKNPLLICIIRWSEAVSLKHDTIAALNTGYTTVKLLINGSVESAELSWSADLFWPPVIGRAASRDSQLDQRFNVIWRQSWTKLQWYLPRCAITVMISYQFFTNCSDCDL